MTVSVLHGDASSMPDVPDASVALVLTSPPYFPRELDAVLPVLPRDSADRADIADRLIAYAAAQHAVFAESARTLRPGGAMVVQTRDVRLGARLVGVSASHRASLEAAGLELYARYLWLPASPPMDRLRDLERCARRGRPRPDDPEELLVFVKPPASSREAHPVDAADIEALQGHLIRTGRGRLPEPHPHQSPVPLARLFVRAFTAPGELVLDPYAGHGTMLHAAMLEGRDAIGYEIDRERAEAASRNLGLR